MLGKYENRKSSGGVLPRVTILSEWLNQVASEAPAFGSAVRSGPLGSRPNAPIGETIDGQVSGATVESRVPLLD